MNSSSKKIIFRNSGNTWRITWTIGIALLLLSNALGHNLFYLYYYFFSVGVLSLINSLTKYSSIDDTGLTLYYGSFFNRKRISFFWNIIESALLTKIEKSYATTIGGRIRIPVQKTIEQEAIVLKFRDISQSDKAINMENSLEYKTDEIEINRQEKVLVLKIPPHGGFKRLLLEMRKYVSINMENSDVKMLKCFYYAITALNALIFFAAVTLGVTL